jgi:hypothetical protein
MPFHDRDLVIQALRDPQCVREWAMPQFDLLLRQGMRSNLLTRLAELFDEHDLGSFVPPGLAGHLGGARRLLRSHRAEIQREVAFILKALEPLGVPIVLLKGSAYVMAGLPAAKGRLFSDVDILVPKSSLPEVENALMLAGWATTHHSTYDQHYYRKWMHELPPLVHIRRQTALDVHHAIVPETGRWRFSSAPLLADAVPLSGSEGLFVLAPTDMVLHSMVHLLLNDELSHGLRDVSDLDLLLRHFGAEPAFWGRLVERAEQLGLRRALHHGLWCASEVLGTPVPAAVSSRVASWGPGFTAAVVLKWAWRRALISPHPSTADASTSWAMFALYVRAHWVRMPPLMLARHLFIKGFKLHERPDKSA